MKDYRLYIFDVDGTLVHPKSGGELRKTADDWEWLPGRLEKLQQLKAEGKFIRFATNQGGVAFDYLKEHEVQNEFMNMIEQIGYSRGHNITHVCFTHPNSRIAKYMDNSNRRKPGPGMLLEAMRHEDVTQEDTLMIGDRPEDEQAAEAANVDFMWADDFFKQDQNATDNISPEADIIMQNVDPAVRNAYEEEMVNPSPKRPRDDDGPAIII